jgi:hypothetical protein
MKRAIVKMVGSFLESYRRWLVYRRIRREYSGLNLR